MSRHSVALAAAVLLLLISACSTTPPPEAALRNPAEITRWDMRAALLARGAQSGRGSLRWEQGDNRFRITVSGPFGLGATRLEGNFDTVVVSRGDEQLVSYNPERDLAEAVGAPVPLAGLEDWIRGLSGEQSAWKQEDSWASGSWVVVIDARERVGEYELPVEMRLESEGQQLQLSRMRWSLPAVDEAKAP